MNNRVFVASSLMILGGFLGLFLATISFLSVPLMANVMKFSYATVWQYASLMGRYGMIGYPDFGVDLNEIMLPWSVLSLAGAFFATCGGLRIARRVTLTNELLVAAGAVLLLLTFSWIPALMVIAGCLILAF